MACPCKIRKTTQRQYRYLLRRRFDILTRSFVGSALIDYLLAKGCDILKHSVVPTIRIADFQKSLPADIVFDDLRTALESSGYIRFDFRRGAIKLLTTPAAGRHND